MRTMIDLSHWQDNKTGAPPDLSKAVENAVDGFLFRAGRGIGTTNRFDMDPSFDIFALQAGQLGMPWGAYWWGEPRESTPQAQAELFLGRAFANGRQPSFLDVDIEGFRGAPMSPLEEAQWQRSFIDELHHGCDLPIVIYTADWYWDGHIFPSGINFSDCDLRVAHHYKDTKPPARATGWTAWLAGRQPDPVKGFGSWVAWQFSAEGNGLGPAMGVESADVDLNIVKDETWDRWFPKPDQTADINRRLTRIEAKLDEPWEAIITRSGQG